MKVVEDRMQVEDEPIALVITGDGQGEFRRLKALAEQFGDDSALLLPQRNERYLTRPGRTRSPPTGTQVGLDALDALELYKSRLEYRFTTFLFLVDAEHIDGDPAECLDTKFSEICSGDDVQIVPLNDSAFICRGRIGSQEIEVYAAIIGDRFGFIEDCIARLLDLAWENQIEASDKDEFKGKVRNAMSGGTFNSLVESATLDQIRESFPGLSHALEELHQNHQ